MKCCFIHSQMLHNSISYRSAKTEEQDLQGDPAPVQIQDGYYRAQCYWICQFGFCELYC